MSSAPSPLERAGVRLHLQFYCRIPEYLFKINHFIVKYFYAFRFEHLFHPVAAKMELASQQSLAVHHPVRWYGRIGGPAGLQRIAHHSRRALSAEVVGNSAVRSYPA